MHTFAVHEAATTGNFCLKESSFQTKGNAAQNFSILVIPHCSCSTSIHIVSNPLTSTLYAQQAV